MNYVIYQGEKTEISGNGIPVLKARVTGFFTLKVTLFKGDKVVFQATHFALAFYRSIRILYQDLSAEITLLKTNSFSYHLLYGGNEISIKYRFRKVLLIKNWEQVGRISYARGIRFGYSLATMEIDAGEEDLFVYFAILYFLHNPKTIN